MKHLIGLALAIGLVVVIILAVTGVFTPNNSTPEKLPQNVHENTQREDVKVVVEKHIHKPERLTRFLHIGAHVGQEMSEYLKNGVMEGVFVEAFPATFLLLQTNVEDFNRQHGTRYKAIQALLTNEDNKTYDFHVFSNHGMSSSIYESNDEEWQWDDVKQKEKVQLQSIRLATLIQQQGWNIEDFDLLVIDVQGAELEVLKGFNGQFQWVKKLEIEVSTVEFYKGGVLFEDLNRYLENQGLRADGVAPKHGNLAYYPYH